MYLIKTRTPWGTDSYCLITEGHGAAAQGDVMAQVYNRVLGRFTEASWDEYNALIREAWERVGLVGDDLARRVGVERQAAVDEDMRVGRRVGRAGQDRRDRRGNDAFRLAHRPRPLMVSDPESSTLAKACHLLLCPLKSPSQDIS